MAKRSRSNTPVQPESVAESMNFEASVDILEGAAAVIIDVEGNPGAAPTRPIDRNQGYYPIVHWGIGNNYPQQVLEMAIQSPELLSLLEYLITVIYGDGIGYQIRDKETNQFVDHFDEEVDNWLEANNVDDWLLENIMDMTWFNHAFTEFILTKDRKFICSLGHQQACFTRFETQDKTTGFNEHVYINANWPNAQVGDEYTTKVKTINPDDLNKEDIIREGNEYKYIFPTSLPFPGKLTYKFPGWHSLFPSKWFNISKLIPILKEALMKFQMTIKYLIEVPEEFWVISARDRLNKVWNEMKPAEKRNLKDAVKAEMDKFLTGPENSGKAFMTTFGWDKINKCVIPGVSIKPLEDKLKDGKYIMDSKEASGQFARAVGLPLPLMGPLSSGDMGAGSGSDARIHWNILNNRLITRKKKSVKPLNLVAKYNGWRKRMPGFRFYLKSSVMDTLDVNHSTSNPAQPQPKTTKTNEDDVNAD